MSLLIRKAAPADAGALCTLYLHHLTQTAEEKPQDAETRRAYLLKIFSFLYAMLASRPSRHLKSPVKRRA